ncbi:hypothetical protein Pcinc_039301 [Petrolisthes cinctipes]|uniref:THAP-type domain-containing protein n=1 Tax=Petrolisthes cinctipes TaxID=88211 RepID=A0AAE1BNW4_PETCI|nr:hypothetical protein Pcinc_039301 [Petrolisthes cinctipes]
MSGACAVSGCTANRMKLKSIIPFYKFPEDKKLRQKWVNCCMRKTEVDPNTEKICMLHFEKKYFLNRSKNVHITKIELKDDAFPKLCLPFSKDIPWLRIRKPEIILEGELNGDPNGKFKGGITSARFPRIDMAGRQEQITLAKSLDFLLGPEEQQPWQDNYNIKTESSKSPNSDNDICIEEHSIDDPIHNDGYKIEELSSTHRDQSSQQDVVMGARNSEEEEVMTYQVLTGRQQDVTGRDHTPTTQPSTSTGKNPPSHSFFVLQRYVVRNQ